jgi:3-deoxy-manno-octulosonate cytidylyltransferase (CMP-KDO synthetase)
MSNRIAIVIPARFQSSRFPGKPLAMLGDKTMLEHTCASALKAADALTNTQVIVATDEQGIFDKAQSIPGITPVMTPASCACGTDRVLAAIDHLALEADIIVNLQGDAPLTPSDFITRIAMYLVDHPHHRVATPAVQLSWQALDQLRANKQHTPFSGTTVVMDANKQALWFSKNIIPAIRNEAHCRTQEPRSPVYQHIGLYAFQDDALRQFANLAQSPYEHYEGLEQLRMLENGLPIHIEVVHPQQEGITSGIDTPEDLARANQQLQQSGADTLC